MLFAIAWQILLHDLAGWIEAMKLKRHILKDIFFFNSYFWICVAACDRNTTFRVNPHRDRLFQVSKCQIGWIFFSLRLYDILHVAWRRTRRFCFKNDQHEGKRSVTSQAAPCHVRRFRDRPDWPGFMYLTHHGIFFFYVLFLYHHCVCVSLSEPLGG